MTELAKSQKESSKKSDARNRAALRALVLPIRKDMTPPTNFDEGASEQPGFSKTVTEDPWTELGRANEIIDPPFDLITLAMLPEHNTELTPVIETMETNIDGFGFILQSRISSDLAPKEIQNAVKREKMRLTNFFNYVNLRDSFTALRRKMRKDLETTGNAYWEVIRNAAGEIQGFEHIPSYQMRLTPVEGVPVEVEFPTLQLQEDDSVSVVKVKTWHRFRRFVQARIAPHRGLAVVSGYRMRYFKEFGDTRVYDNETGAVVPLEKVLNWKDTFMPMPYAQRANEVIHFKLYSTRSPYGLPRYIGNLLSIFGARAAEEINYVTFRNNNIPSMAVLVSNGQLTEGSIERITSFVESQIQGSDNYSKFLIIEAEGDLEGDDATNVKVEIKPLVKEQHRDALFQNYSRNNQDNVRRAFRLPPIFTGKSDDYTRATADASRRLADEQVFAPEREEFDSLVNRLLFPAMGVIYHRFKSNSPNTTDNKELVSILSGAEKTGGMTPRIARVVLEGILGRELPRFPNDERFNPDLPFSLLMAEAVKNKGDPAEPGQQLTALKDLGILGGDEEPDSEAVQTVVSQLGKLRSRLEAQWQKEISFDADDG